MSYIGRIAVPPEPEGVFAGIVARLRRTNWYAAIAALVLEGAFLALLGTIGIMTINRPKQEVSELKVFPVSQQAAPAPSAPEREEAKPVPQVQPKTQMVVPKAEVPIPTVRAVAAATQAPTTPAPPAAPSAPAAPPAPAAASGPVSVPNLSTNQQSGSPPAYPMGSRRKREQGTVVLRLVLSETGRVSEISIEKSSGFAALDEAALAAVRTWRWYPTIRDGKPIIITGLVKIPFILKNS